MKNGFTLAEVLITLGIIGVVAAMTLPTLIQNHQKRSLEVATQKFYSMMSQAVKQYMADEGVDDLRNTQLTYWYNPDLDQSAIEANDEKTQKACEDFVQKYLRIAKVCENGCFADNYKTQENEISWAIGTKTENYKGAFALVDGTVLDIISIVGNPIILLVDVNGRKGPNKIGYDLWEMTVFYDGSIDEGGVNPECRKYGGQENCGKAYGVGNTPSEVRANRFLVLCKYSSYGGCFGHFLENNSKFDY